MNKIDRESYSTDRADRFTERQREHNKRAKEWTRIFGANLSLCICIMIPALLIGFIWTDASLPRLGMGLICDGILTVFLFFLAEYSMIRIGMDGGRLDDDYVKYHREYIELTKAIRERGVALMYPFCEWQIELEYETAVKERLRSIRVPYTEWKESYRHMELEELKEALGVKKAVRVLAVNAMLPIELTPDMILTDGRKRAGRGGISESGEDYVERKKKSWRHILIGALTAIFTISVALTLTQDVSFARVLYTVVKLTALLFRMASGYNSGAKAYNTVEVLHIQSKLALEYSYIEYLDKRLYENFGDRYGDVSQILPNDKSDKSDKPDTSESNTQ